MSRGPSSPSRGKEHELRGRRPAVALGEANDELVRVGELGRLGSGGTGIAGGGDEGRDPWSRHPTGHGEACTLQAL